MSVGHVHKRANSRLGDIPPGPPGDKISGDVEVILLSWEGWTCSVLERSLVAPHLAPSRVRLVHPAGLPQ